jgi:hypothetical protein
MLLRYDEVLSQKVNKQTFEEYRVNAKQAFQSVE